MIVSLHFPHKLLWPNGSVGNRHAKAREAAKHKQWAWTAAKGAHGAPEASEGQRAIKLIVYPKAKGAAPDRDNCIAASKHYLDGIAQALGVNDRSFAAPTVEFGPREGRFEFVL